jgi:hypothetical protein
MDTLKRIIRIGLYALCAYVAIVLTLQFIEFSMLTTYIVRVGMIVLAIELIDWATPRIDFVEELLNENMAIGIAIAGFLIASALLINAV